MNTNTLFFNCLHQLQDSSWLQRLAKATNPGDNPILGYIWDVQLEWVSFKDQKSANGCKFLPKTCEWIIILIHEIHRLVTISIILPGNGWFSCKLNRTYCNLANFGSCSILYGLGMGLFCLLNQFLYQLYKRSRENL